MAEHALPSVIATLSEGARPNVRLIGLLALGHMIIDVNQVAAMFLPAPRDHA